MIALSSCGRDEVTCVRSWSDVHQANRGYHHVVHDRRGLPFQGLVGPEPSKRILDVTAPLSWF